MQKKCVLIILSLSEILIMTILILFDILLPSLLIIAAGAAFMVFRKERPIFFNKNVWNQPVRFLLCTAGLGIVLSVFDYTIVIPALNHLTHTTQNMSAFAALKGNAGLMLIMLAYSWIVAATCEEIAYRGFFQSRIVSLFSDKKLGTVIAVLATSLLFGLMHLEQGIVGMITTALDAVILSIIRYRFKSIWASVLVHGFSNMIGIVTFYFTGPIYGLW